MNIDEIYRKVIEDLSKGHRALVRYSQCDLEFLKDRLDDSRINQEMLEKVLCLVNHSALSHSPFEKSLIQLLNTDLPDHLTVFVLNCTRRHIVEARGKRGDRLPFDFLEALKKLLHSRSPEVVEWTLRTIEECGNQGVYFLREFDKIKPPPWKWFNEHQRAVREIIRMLEERWRQLENPEKR